MFIHISQNILDSPKEIAETFIQCTESVTFFQAAGFNSHPRFFGRFTLFQNVVLYLAASIIVRLGPCHCDSTFTDFSNSKISWNAGCVQNFNLYGSSLASSIVLNSETVISYKKNNHENSMVVETILRVGSNVLPESYLDAFPTDSVVVLSVESITALSFNSPSGTDQTAVGAGRPNMDIGILNARLYVKSKSTTSNNIVFFRNSNRQIQHCILHKG